MGVRRNQSQPVVKEGGFLAVPEVARMLRCCEEVVRRHLRAGTLIGHKMPGLGRNTTWKIPVAGVIHLLTAKRNVEFRERLVEQFGGGEALEYRALMALVADVELAVGPNRLVECLVKLNATDLDGLHPDRYAEVRAALMKLLPGR